MGIYRKYILPKIVHYTCGLKPTMKQREKIVPRAKGKVLEVGIGSGLNLPYYSTDQIQQVWGLDPSPEMWALAKENLGKVDLNVEFIEAGAEQIPLDDGIVDTILVTYTLCTLPQVQPALEEMRRVLGPQGELIFCEHGRAPDRNVQRWQNWLNPVWKRVGGGCNLNLPIPLLLRESGFEILDLESMYIPGWKFASFNYWGTARPSAPG
jgi:ubiquinone/menaquinone biosynthesis C-methylase UbiE